MASKFFKAFTTWFGSGSFDQAQGESVVTGPGGIGSPIGLLITLTKVS